MSHSSLSLFAALHSNKLNHGSLGLGPKLHKAESRNGMRIHTQACRSTQEHKSNMYVHTCTHTRMTLDIWMRHIHVCMHTHTHTHTHACRRTRRRTRIHMHASAARLCCSPLLLASAARLCCSPLLLASAARLCCSPRTLREGQSIVLHMHMVCLFAYARMHMHMH